MLVLFIPFTAVSRLHITYFISNSVFVKFHVIALVLVCLLSEPVQSSVNVVADTGNSLKGRVKDVSTGNVLPAAFVEIRDKEDSYFQVSYTDSTGHFFFKGPPAGSYTVSIMAPGYLTYNYAIFYKGTGETDFGEFALFPEKVEMEEVTVKTSRLLIQFDADKLIYSVEDDPQSRGSMLMPILKKIPGIQVENNRDITVNGSSYYMVLVNGRRSSLFLNDPSDVFRSFPASAVKQIEILSTPPSRYESEFIGGVINLVLDQYTIDGFRGSVNSQLSSPLSYTGSSYVTAKRGILGVNAYGSIDTGRDPRSKSEEYIKDNTFNTVTRSEGVARGNYSNGNYNAEYNLTPDIRNLISITTSGRGDRGRSADRLEIRETGDADAGNYLSENNSSSARSYSTIQADYERRSKLPDKHLYTVSFRRISNKTLSRYNYLYRETGLPLPERTQAGNDDIYREGTAQMDYVYTFKRQSLEAGIKNIRRSSRSDYFQEEWDPEADLFFQIPENSSHFSYIQSIWGGYSSVNLKYKNFSLRAGARAEAVGLDVDYISTQTSLRKDYFNIIPSLRLNGRFNTAGRFNLSYTRRVQRPGLMYLNPYVNKSEVLYHFYGNPDLDPAIADVYYINYSLFRGKTNYSVSGNYSGSRNSIQSYYLMGPDSILHSTFANIGRYHNSGVTMSLSRQFFEQVSVNISGAVRYNEYSGRSGGRNVLNKGTSYSGNVHLGMPVMEDGYFSGSMSWSSGGVSFQGRNSGAVNTHFSFSWDPQFNRNLTFDLSVDNLFRKMQTRKYTVDNEQFHMVFNSYSQVRMFALSANYRFGKFKGVLKRKARDIVNDDQVE
jgi:hypothetical protein